MMMTMMPIRESVCQPASQSVSQSVRETNLYIFTGGKMIKRGYKLGLDQGRKKKSIMILTL